MNDFQKVRQLLPFADTLGFAVDEYAGNRGKMPPRRRLSKKVVYVATIEKVCTYTQSVSSLLVLLYTLFHRLMG